MVHTNFGGNSYGPIVGPYLFLGKFVWTNPERFSKVSPYTGIGPWMALFPVALVVGRYLFAAELFVFVGQDFNQTYAHITGNQGLAQIFLGPFSRLKHRKTKQNNP